MYIYTYSPHILKALSFPHAVLVLRTHAVTHVLSSKKTRHSSVQSLVSQQLAAPPLLHDLPKTSALHTSWSYYTEQVAHGHQEHSPMGKCVIPVCCASLYFDYLLWIRRKLMHHDDNPLCSNTAVFHLLRSFILVVVPQFRLAPVCVGCTEEKKGFAGIMSLQQTKDCSKLGVVPSDTWSALNLTTAQGGVWDWRGHCFRVIIFKSLGRGSLFNVQFIHCCSAGAFVQCQPR